MNLNRLIRLLLLLLFVLLQCMAPLVHAHVNGDVGGQHVHLAEVDAAWLETLEHHAGAVHFAHVDHHSAVVCMPPECRSYALGLEQPALIGREAGMQQREHGRIAVTAYCLLPNTTRHFSRPHSQAPPA